MKNPNPVRQMKLKVILHVKFLNQRMGRYKKSALTNNLKVAPKDAQGGALDRNRSRKVDSPHNRSDKSISLILNVKISGKKEKFHKFDKYKKENKLKMLE